MTEVARIPVCTPGGSYEVHVGTEILHTVGDVTRSVVRGSNAVIVCDSNVAPYYAQPIMESLSASGFHVSAITFPAGEEHKRMGTLATIIDDIADAELTRADVVIAAGGGVTGDMAGLAAALYLRGIAVVQVPTSLLAMVDSSVGGKTAIDIAAGKNLVGAFWQPRAVLADVTVLQTLPSRVFADACGEVIKHGVLADEALFNDIAEDPLTNGHRTPADMARVVARNVEIKRDVVNADEREGGVRQTLNLGHTIGHAIEAASDFTLGHGACVAAGLCAISRASVARGWCEADVANRIESCVAAHGLPTDTAVDHKELLAYAVHDKKRAGAGVNVVVPQRVGHVGIRHVSLAEFAELIELGCGTGEAR